MNNSIFLAKFWGCYLLVFIHHYRADKYFSKYYLEFNWKLIITLIGWMELLKGGLFIFPKKQLVD